MKYQVLNTMDYGNIPQNRERIYIVAFNDIKVYKEFEFPKPIELTTKLSDLVDFNNKVDSKYYYTNDNFMHFEQLKATMKNRKLVISGVEFMLERIEVMYALH